MDGSYHLVHASHSQAEGLPGGSLAPAHRLDSGTEGLVLLVQGPAAARAAAVLMRREGGAGTGSTSDGGGSMGGGTVRKTYRCLTLVPPPVGRVVHYALMNVRERGAPTYTRVLPGGGVVDAGGVQRDSRSAVTAGPLDDTGSTTKGAKRCELIVESVTHVQLTGDAARQYGSHGYEATVTLITGRTHQVRV